MIILTMVVTVTAGMVWQQTRAVEVEAAERARVQAAWILGGALDWARLILREDQRNNRQPGRNYDALDEPWATPLAEARLSTFLAADKDNNADAGPEAFLSGSIVDAQARYNLRGLVDAEGKPAPTQMAALQRLCQLAGLPVPTAVNVNTAPREVLVAALDGLDLGSAERLVQRRQRRPFATLDEVKAELPEGAVVDATRISVGSSFFEVAGRLRLEERVLEERSLLERRGGDRGGDVVVLRRERRSFLAASR